MRCERRSIDIRPVKPNTIAKSLAIGNPADGYYASGFIQKTGGWAEDATDEEISEGISLLAETEGIYTETAGGVTIAVDEEAGRAGPDRSAWHHGARDHRQRPEDSRSRHARTSRK